MFLFQLQADEILGETLNEIKLTFDEDKKNSPDSEYPEVDIGEVVNIKIIELEDKTNESRKLETR